MAGWRSRVGDLLYDGEDIRETVDFAEASVVVTSHRVLAFEENGDGPTLQQADRPNVEGVTTGSESETDLLARGVRTGIIGIVLLAAGVVVDFESIVGDVNLDAETASRVGMGELMGMMQTLLNFITRLDYLMRVFGALALFLAVVFVGVFWLTRDPTLVVEVAGDDDIHLTRPDETGDVAERIEEAVRPETPDRSGSEPAAGDPLGEA
jgi:hypothetical protein